jgi:hypothetical protein
MVTTKKVSKPAPRMIRAASRSVATRHRSHALAPEHLGEPASLALIVMAVGGIAVLISAVAVLVSGFTMPNRFASSAPPNLAQLGIGQVIGGGLVLILSLAIVGAVAGTFLDLRGARGIAVSLGVLTAAAAAAGVVAVMTIGGGDQPLALVLLVIGILFAASSVILGRTRLPEPATQA